MSTIREAAGDAGPMPPTPADWAAALDKMRHIEAEVKELLLDKELLDFVEAQSDGSFWVARQSTTGRGFRLHNTGGQSHPFEKATAREAIGAARERMK